MEKTDFAGKYEEVTAQINDENAYCLYCTILVG